MNGLKDDIVRFVLDFRANVFYRSLAYGIVFSLLITFVLGSIVGVFKLLGTFPYFDVRSQEYWVGIVFVSFSILFAFFGYMSEMISRDDILTPLRKRLVGYWKVRSQTWVIGKDKVELSHLIDTCTIGIDDVGRKLVLHFDVQHNEIFKDKGLNITNVGLGYQGEPKQLFYFCEAKLPLKKPLGSEQSSPDNITFPFMAILEVHTKDKEINHMEGWWYDLDNTLLTLAKSISGIEGLEEFQKSVEAASFKGKITFDRMADHIRVGEQAD